jgi:serine/threonine-protein kinase HipA
MLPDYLEVFLNNGYAGRLSQEGGNRFRFQYHQDWLDNPSVIPLSLSLPLRLEPYVDENARPFFANLLPEGNQRPLIARRLGISESNDYALLAAIGGECAGAVSLWPPGETPNMGGSYEPLTQERLQTIIQDLPSRPLLAGEEGVRLSLAGVQSKLPVYVEGGNFYLPLGALPSSHILKPAAPTLIGITENEAYCLHLAEAVGLQVAHAEIRALPSGVPYLLVERYDRVRDAENRLQRLHQEDFCQALRCLPGSKYEAEGGPTVAQVAALLREHSARPIVDIEALVRWTALNYIIGNADAHAKNISLLLQADGPILAPFYDLLSTAIYGDVSQRFAMSIGGKTRWQSVRNEHWRMFAKDVGMKPSAVLGLIEKLAIKLREVAPGLRDQFTALSNTKHVINDIASTISQRAAFLLAELKVSTHDQ